MKYKTFKVVVIVLLSLFDLFIPTSANPLLFLDKWFILIYLNFRFDHDLEDKVH